MGSIPFYEFEYKGATLKRTQTAACAGDCFTYLKTNFDMSWTQSGSSASPVTNSRICTADDLGKALYDEGSLQVCPPKSSELEMK